MYGLSFDKINVIIVCWTSTVVTASKKVKMITSTRNLPLSYFLLSRKNKLDRDLLYCKNLTLVCPLRNHVTSLLSRQSLRSRKNGGHRE